MKFETYSGLKQLKQKQKREERKKTGTQTTSNATKTSLFQ